MFSATSHQTLRQENQRISYDNIKAIFSALRQKRLLNEDGEYSILKDPQAASIKLDEEFSKIDYKHPSQDRDNEGKLGFAQEMAESLAVNDGFERFSSDAPESKYAGYRAQIWTLLQEGAKEAGIDFNKICENVSSKNGERFI